MRSCSLKFGITMALILTRNRLTGYKSQQNSFALLMTLIAVYKNGTTCIIVILLKMILPNKDLPDRALCGNINYNMLFCFRRYFY